MTRFKTYKLIQKSKSDTDIDLSDKYRLMHKKHKDREYAKPITRMRDNADPCHFNYTLTKIQHIDPADFKPEDIRLMNNTSILTQYRAQVTKMAFAILILSLCSFIIIIIDV